MTKEQIYEEIISILKQLLKATDDLIANAANIAAVLYQHLPDVNWAGFYFLHDSRLVLGPFQGKPACVNIPLGKGVCGTAAERQETIVVPDVHKFPGHIACDPASQSEIVVPLFFQNKLIGVLDLDSPQLQRFDQLDKQYLEMIATLLCSQVSAESVARAVPAFKSA